MTERVEMGSHLRMKGQGVRFLWPTEQGNYSQDDYLVDPAAGIAIFAAGSGVLAQGRPAAKVAVWSLWGEVTRRSRSQSLEEAVIQGFHRAHTAVERLSWRWPSGLVRPSASMVALLYAGDEALVAHLGDCRVSLLAQDDLVPLTVEHQVKAYPSDIHLDASVVPHLLPAIANSRTRSLGGAAHHVPELLSMKARHGHRFLLAGPSLHHALTNECIANCHHTDDGAPAELGVFSQCLISASHGVSPEVGTVAFAVVDAVESTAAIVHEARLFGSGEPPLSWLYHPGSPLPDAPEDWRWGRRGPDAAWYEAVSRELRLDG